MEEEPVDTLFVDGRRRHRRIRAQSASERSEDRQHSPTRRAHGSSAPVERRRASTRFVVDARRRRQG